MLMVEQVEHLTITVYPRQAEIIRTFCFQKDMTVSSVLRRGALELIRREQNGPQ